MTFVAADVEGLHANGRTVSGRSDTASGAANKLKVGLDSAGGGMGHPLMGQAVTSFAARRVTDRANLLAANTEATGRHVSNVSGTLRNEDIEGAHEVRVASQGVFDIQGRINGHVSA